MINDKFIFVTIGRNKKRRIELNEILYLEADNVYTNIKLKDGEELVISTPLAIFKKTLRYKSSPFSMIGRSHIVNLKNITSTDSGVNSTVEFIGKYYLKLGKSSMRKLCDTLQNNAINSHSDNSFSQNKERLQTN